MQEAEEILDMVFQSPLHEKADKIRCFKTERDRFVFLLTQGLTNQEQTFLLKLIDDRLRTLT